MCINIKCILYWYILLYILYLTFYSAYSSQINHKYSMKVYKYYETCNCKFCNEMVLFLMCTYKLAEEISLDNDIVYLQNIYKYYSNVNYNYRTYTDFPSYTDRYLMKLFRFYVSILGCRVDSPFPLAHSFIHDMSLYLYIYFEYESIILYHICTHIIMPSYKN